MDDKSVQSGHYHRLQHWSDESQDDELLKVIPVDLGKELLRAEIRVRIMLKHFEIPYVPTYLFRLRNNIHLLFLFKNY